jgi:hypothetical protein
VSLSWRDQVRIALFPDRLVLVRMGRGWRPRVLARAVVPIAASTGWQPALSQLAETLKGRDWQHADAVVVLSSHFVRHLLHSASVVNLTAAEREAMLRHRFDESYGDMGGDMGGAWEYRLSDANPGETTVACAVEKAMLAGLREIFRASTLRQRGIQPYLMVVFNALRSRLDARPRWLLLAEPGLLCTALFADGQWRALRTRLISEERFAEDARLALEREALLAGLGEESQSVYLYAADESASGLKSHGRWMIESLKLRPLAGVAPSELVRYAAALPGSF